MHIYPGLFRGGSATVDNLIHAYNKVKNAFSIQAPDALLISRSEDWQAKIL